MLRAAAVALVGHRAVAHSPSELGAMTHRWEKPAPPSGVTGSDIDYVVDGETYEGYLAMPPEGMQPVGGLLVAHAFLGLDEDAKARADQFAGMGYVSFAVDVYGKGNRCAEADCARALMNAAKANETKLKMLLSAGTDQLLAAYGNTDKLVAIGYCFGGGNVLELARHPGVGASNGVVYKAVSAIHASLDPFYQPASQGTIVTQVQVHHGQLDPQGDAGLLRLEAELINGTDGSEGLWETVKYAKVPHAWTAPSDHRYNARAAVQAHESSYAFFQKALGNLDPIANGFPLSSCPPVSESGTASTSGSIWP